jgi:hypothetical protein
LILVGVIGGALVVVVIIVLVLKSRKSA